MIQPTSPKRVLVTGSGTGIGREIALEFARQGADVVLHFSRNDEGARSAIQEIQTLGRRAAAFSSLLRWRSSPARVPLIGIGRRRPIRPPVRAL